MADKYRDSMDAMKARAKALKDADREPIRYLERSELCDNIWCGLCYKGRGEKAPWNR